MNCGRCIQDDIAKCLYYMVLNFISPIQIAEEDRLDGTDDIDESHVTDDNDGDDDDDDNGDDEEEDDSESEPEMVIDDDAESVTSR